LRWFWDFFFFDEALIMVEIDGDHLTIEQVAAVARGGETVELSAAGKEKIKRSHQILEDIINLNKPVYGINTGFGIFADQRIPRAESARLSRNLILSHSVGRGVRLDTEIVRAALLIRANTLTKGFSGVRLEIVTTLLAMLNKGVTPLVPEQGSLGSSGDLGPLSHMALVFSTDQADLEEESGWAEYKGEILRGKIAMQKASIERLILGPKEGLAINNGATFSAAIGALAVFDGLYLYGLANRSAAMTIEALEGCSYAFDDRIHAVRGQLGQIEAAEQIRNTFTGSTFVDTSGRVQDAYSLRCAPQVHGIVSDTLQFVRGIIERELNAVTDNPILFAPAEAISGGNFHGEPIGMAMDYLGIAISELGAISERRTFRLTDGTLNGGLPPMLVDHPEAAGLNSGLMMPQYSAAALVLENQTLAQPDSVHSLPTSANQEDHNANAMTAARHTRTVVENVRQILAIELYTAARAVDLRKRQFPEKHLGNGSSILHQTIRTSIPYQAGDALWGAEIDQVLDLIQKRVL
jgi:histidine ammonia-lyase